VAKWLTFPEPPSIGSGCLGGGGSCRVLPVPWGRGQVCLYSKTRGKNRARRNPLQVQQWERGTAPANKRLLLMYKKKASQVQSEVGLGAGKEASGVHNLRRSAPTWYPCGSVIGLLCPADLQKTCLTDEHKSEWCTEMRKLKQSSVGMDLCGKILTHFQLTSFDLCHPKPTPAPRN